MPKLKGGCYYQNVCTEDGSIDDKQLSISKHPKLGRRTGVTGTNRFWDQTDYKNCVNVPGVLLVVVVISTFQLRCEKLLKRGGGRVDFELSEACLIGYKYLAS